MALGDALSTADPQTKKFEAMQSNMLNQVVGDLSKWDDIEAQMLKMQDDDLAAVEKSGFEEDDEARLRRQSLKMHAQLLDEPSDDDYSQYGSFVDTPRRPDSFVDSTPRPPRSNVYSGDLSDYPYSARSVATDYQKSSTNLEPVPEKRAPGPPTLTIPTPQPSSTRIDPRARQVELEMKEKRRKEREEQIKRQQQEIANHLERLKQQSTSIQERREQLRKEQEEISQKNEELAKVVEKQQVALLQRIREGVHRKEQEVTQALSPRGAAASNSPATTTSVDRKNSEVVPGLDKVMKNMEQATQNEGTDSTSTHQLRTMTPRSGSRHDPSREGKYCTVGSCVVM